jgi:5-methylcytosine-specific restriction endonuclease McrA
VRWFEVEARFRHDLRIQKVLRRFGRDGLGSLVLLWGEIADLGSRPGVGVTRAGEPLEVEDLARACGMTLRKFVELMDYCAAIGHIDRDRWKADRVIVLPAMVRRARKLSPSMDQAERVNAFRERRFDRVATLCGGKRCVRCGSREQLELERKVPKDEGGSSDDENLQIVCVPCGRLRRAERSRQAQEGQSPNQSSSDDHRTETERSSGDRSAIVGSDFGVSGEKTAGCNQNDTQDVTRTDVQGTGTGDLDLSTDGTERERSRAREVGLPLIGEVPRPRVNPALAPLATSTLTRDHLKCLGPCVRICLPLDLAHKLAMQLGGDHDAALERIRTFRNDVVAGIPIDQPIGDEPYPFWRAHFATRFASAAPRISSGRRGGPDPAAARVPATPEKLDKYDRLVRRDGDGRTRSTGN